MATMVMSGYGIRKGLAISHSEQFKYSTMDIAPTICHALGFDVPSQSEGRVIHEFFEEKKIGKTSRTLVPVKRNVRKRELKKILPAKPQGDVTDEI